MPPPQCLKKVRARAAAEEQTTGGRRENENLGDFRYVLRAV